MKRRVIFLILVFLLVAWVCLRETDEDRATAAGFHNVSAYTSAQRMNMTAKQYYEWERKITERESECNKRVESLGNQITKIFFNKRYPVNITAHRRPAGREIVLVVNASTRDYIQARYTGVKALEQLVKHVLQQKGNPYGLEDNCSFEAQVFTQRVGVSGASHREFAGIARYRPRTDTIEWTK